MSVNDNKRTATIERLANLGFLDGSELDFDDVNGRYLLFLLRTVRFLTTNLTFINNENRWDATTSEAIVVRHTKFDATSRCLISRNVQTVARFHSVILYLLVPDGFKTCTTNQWDDAKWTKYLCTIQIFVFSFKWWQILRLASYSS